MSQDVTLRSIGASVYLPSAFYTIGEGSIAPVVAISAREMGASVAMASIVVAAIGIGRILGSVPAGILAEHIGERRTLLLSVVLCSVSLAVCVTASTVWALAVGVGLTGVARAAFGLARHAYLTEVMPYRLRARAMSTLGGTQRAGQFVGPFLGAAAMLWLGTDGAYWVALVAVLLAGASLLLFPDPPHGRSEMTKPAGPAPSTLAILRAHLPVWRTLGLAVLLTGAVRASRQVVIPLWGSHIGLDPAAISLVFGLGAAVDMLFFYPAGLVMDRAGRQWVAVPSMLVLAVAHLLLPLTHTVGALVAVGLLVGAGNGMSSGLIATLGADASPDVGRTTFLGAWRLCADIGSGIGPVLIGGVAAIATLGAAVSSAGVVAILTAVAMACWIPRHGPPEVLEPSPSRPLP